MTPPTSVAAVIPHWNRSDLLEKLLANLRDLRPAPCPVFVLDNGSTDNSRQVAERYGARFIPLGRNLGFAAAVNAGVREASRASDSRWIAILNNDVTLAPDWLERLLVHKDAWFVTGKILSERDPSKIDATFDAISRGACPLRCGAGKPDSAYWGRPREIAMAPMTAAIFRRKLFDEIGFLDERFESYLEDADFGVRCALAGKRGVYEPSAVASHLGSATWGAWNPDAVRLQSRNQVLLAAKHFRGQPRWPIMAGQLLWGLVAARHGRGGSWLRGKWQGWSMASAMGGQPNNGEVLAASEQEIRDVQEATGFDRYWRAYFWLSRRS